MQNPKEPDVKEPVMISGKDTDEVDNDFFLVPLAVRDHVGSLLSSFPVENRLTGQVCLFNSVSVGLICIVVALET